MADRPIIFSAPMVRALLDGRKTQTRRMLKPQPVPCLSWSEPPAGTYPSAKGWSRLPYAPGDRLYVREAWRARLYNQSVPPREIDPWATRLHYEADGLPPECDDGTNWNRLRPSIHMPRWVCRLTLTVTDVRVQRLQEISEDDAIDEGCRPFFDESDPQIMKGPNGTEHQMMPLKGPLDAFRALWNSLHGPAAWDANPWVVALTFTVHRCNIDQMESRNA
jgi:hypothetical protein